MENSSDFFLSSKDENGNLIEMTKYLKIKIPNTQTNTNTNTLQYPESSTNNSTQESDDLFKHVTDEMISAWESILIKGHSDYTPVFIDDSEILHEELSLPNQRVIKNDCDRTRVKDQPYLNHFREYIECILTYYCRKNNIQYKQGMNEIIGPFLLLKNKMKMSLSDVYNLFVCFMDALLTNYYYESEFYSLQSSLSLLTLLLKYQEPSLYNMFEYALITPQMYATSWVLTMFANKCKLDVVYHLWDIIIKEQDQLFLHFFIVAFLQVHKQSLLDSDYSQIPSAISQMSIKSVNEVDEIAAIAYQHRQRTPFSFRLLAQKLEIFKPRSTRLKELFLSYEPDNLLAMPILPSEVFHIAYNNVVSCPDNNCINFKNYYEGEGIIFNQTREAIKPSPSGRICYYCTQKNTDNSTAEGIMSYILLDLRIDNKANDINSDLRPGFLPMTVILEQEELFKDEFPEIITTRFINEKKKYHFVLITSETDYFIEYENQFYKENITEKDKRRMMYGLQTHVNKEINMKLVKSLMKKDKSKELTLRLQEFDNLKRSIVSFLRNEYPYVSYVYGGFMAIHEQSLNYSIPLLNHDERCQICRKNKKKSEKVGLFHKIFQSQRKQGSYDFRNQKENEIELASAPVSVGASLSPEAKASHLKNSCSSRQMLDSGILSSDGTITTASKSIQTVEEMASLIADTSIITYTCSLLEHKSFLGQSQKSPQIMLFLSSSGLIIYKLEKNPNHTASLTPMPGSRDKEHSKLNLNDRKRDTLAFVLIESIKIDQITSIRTRKQTKNIVVIQYQEKKKCLNSIVIDLMSDSDSRSFIKKTKQLIAGYSSNSVAFPITSKK